MAAAAVLFTGGIPAGADPTGLLIASNWTGFYLGAHAGGARSKTGFSEFQTQVPAFSFALPLVPSVLVPAQAVTVPGASITATGRIVGAQVGYGWQLSSFVVGVEADVSATSLRSSAQATTALSASSALPGTALTVGYEQQTDWMASLRGRVGFVPISPLLIYGTAGLALARTRVGVSYDSMIDGATSLPAGSLLSGAPLSGSASETRTLPGWTLGFGAEWAAIGGWRLGAEYRHSHFGTSALNIANAAGLAGTPVPAVSDVSMAVDQLTLRLNYRLNGR
jgi:opacity protein-like surface antigen